MKTGIASKVLFIYLGRGTILNDIYLPQLRIPKVRSAHHSHETKHHTGTYRRPLSTRRKPQTDSEEDEVAQTNLINRVL